MKNGEQIKCNSTLPKLNLPKKSVVTLAVFREDEEPFTQTWVVDEWSLDLNRDYQTVEEDFGRYERNLPRDLHIAFKATRFER